MSARRVERMFDDLTTPAVESELVGMAGHLAAGTCRFLQLLAEFDGRGGWAGPGLRSCAHWLGWRIGMNHRTARDHLRVAHALRELPMTTEAFAAGRVSYSKVRALTRIATASTEESLLGIALHGTTAQLESLVAAARAGADPRPAAARRGLRCSRAADGSLLVSLRIPADQGEELVATIEAYLAEHAPEPERAATAPGSAEPPPDGRPADAVEENRRNQEAHDAHEEHLLAAAAEHAPGATSDPAAARRLDALLDLVRGATPTRPAKLVVHLRPDDGTAWIDGGPAIAPSTAERLTCTAGAQAMVVDGRGNPLHLGRTRRTASPQQLMALRARDGNRCAFPGCSNAHHLDAHHLRWWRHGGPTDLDNLALLCTFHHTLIHDHGYRADRTADGIVFRRPDLTRIPAAGPPLRGDADELLAHHTAAHIDGWTITPQWGGERLDRDSVLHWLLPELSAAA